MLNKDLISLNNIKNNFMGSLLYVIAVILIIGWLLGFFFLHAGGLIHLLLVIALIAIIVRVIQGRRVL
ncbi:MAG TPA: lmo0937 family membrane protein, partial [Chitinophagaceae bacterium]|nr:lmo0937 family membrane protein [Chitinophagaceae bacterium]